MCAWSVGFTHGTTPHCLVKNEDWALPTMTACKASHKKRTSLVLCLLVDRHALRGWYHIFSIVRPFNITSHTFLGEPSLYSYANIFGPNILELPSTWSRRSLKRLGFLFSTIFWHFWAGSRAANRGRRRRRNSPSFIPFFFYCVECTSLEPDHVVYAKRIAIALFSSVGFLPPRVVSGAASLLTCRLSVREIRRDRFKCVQLFTAMRWQSLDIFDEL